LRFSFWFIPSLDTADNRYGKVWAAELIGNPWHL
jgi:hypothetical protein